jgi:hypothetical protein
LDQQLRDSRRVDKADASQASHRQQGIILVCGDYSPVHGGIFPRSLFASRTASQGREVTRMAGMLQPGLAHQTLRQ